MFNRQIELIMNMEDLKTMFEERTSVRRYERDPISDYALSVIYSAIQNTPTSYNGQQFSVIEVSDQSMKEQIYEIVGQKQIKTCNRFFIFCADYHKIKILSQKKGLEMPNVELTLDGVMVGVIDATLAMSNALIAAQSCGLGSCCIGYTRTADPQRLAELLNLPKGVFVVCGLAVGVPRESPDVKPKQPKGTVIHKDRYNEEGLVERLEYYDNMIKAFNATRNGQKTDNDWCGHILDYYKDIMDYRILEYVQQQGFDVRM